MTKKICPYPFSRLELGHRSDKFVPCCSAWFKDEYFKEFKPFEGKSPEDLYSNMWNSPQAQALRESMLDGSFKYCERDRCHIPLMTLDEIKKSDPKYFETPITEKNLSAIENNETLMPDGPASISMSADFACNLKCPTCRNNLVTKNNPHQQKFVDAEIDFVLNNSASIKVLKLTNSGEPFFSQNQRDLLKKINKDAFPQLRTISVVTNGLLFDQKTFDALKPGTEFIKKITVSIDAGNSKTYSETRGGDWNRLMKNLKWIAEKRKNGEFEWLTYSFVLRKANYESIPELMQLADENQVDTVEFIQYDDWRALYRMPLKLSDRYDDEAIHIPTHPDHDKLKQVLEPFRQDQRVLINIESLN